MLVMGYQELNQYINIFMTDADACASKLREWRQHWSNVYLVGLPSSPGQ